MTFPDIDLSPFHSLMYLIGEVTILFIIGAILVSFVLVVISLYSIRKGHLYFPRLDQGRQSFSRRIHESILPAGRS